MGGNLYDAIIVGGGPAGLSAALILGRCRRRVLVCDAGRPRNAASHALHGFLTRDGIRPAELPRIAREQLRRYGVEYRRVTVRSAVCVAGGFRVIAGGGATLYARKLLLATGLVDRLPPLQGIRALYGRSVFHCPYCDAWEVRDQPLAVYGRGKPGAALAKSLQTWSRDVILCGDGDAELPRAHRAALARSGIRVYDQRIVRLEGTRGQLRRIVFADGDSVSRHALFFSTGYEQKSSFAARLGCEFTKKGVVRVRRFEATKIPGLYVAGDASEDVQLAIVAAAEGAKAGFAINKALQHAAVAPAKQ